MKGKNSQHISLLLGGFLMLSSALFVVSMMKDSFSTDIRSKAAPIGPYDLPLSPSPSTVKKPGGYPGCGDKWCVPVKEWPSRCVEKVPVTAKDCSIGKCCTLKILDD